MPAFTILVTFFIVMHYFFLKVKKNHALLFSSCTSKVKNRDFQLIELFSELKKKKYVHGLGSLTRTD